MFGYVTIRKPDMKIKDYERYHGFYCGLCETLRQKYGLRGQITLTYDMTFLVILLASLYEERLTVVKKHCVVHPAKRHIMIYNKATEYGADLNMLLSYFHFQDDYEDERDAKAAVGMKLYHRIFHKIKIQYPNQVEVIEKNLKKLHELELQNCQEISKVADCFGALMACLFRYREDAFADDLSRLGYHLGRFIYAMDAYDDLEEDLRKGCYNPFVNSSKQNSFEKMVKQFLLTEMVEVSNAFEKLPCVKYIDILRNIIYAGVWNRYDKIQDKRIKEKK